MKIIKENWRNASESVEVVELNNGSNVATFIKDGEAIIFASIYDLCCYMMGGQKDIVRIYCKESTLNLVYATPNGFLSLYKHSDLESYDLTIAGGDYNHTKKLYFMYAAIMTNNSGEFMTVTNSVICDKYPKKMELVAMVAKQYPYAHGIDIISLVQQTEEQYEHYWSKK